jgi:hypothetical protein
MFPQGEAGTEKKNGIFMYNKNKMVCYKRNFGRGRTWGNEAAGEKERREKEDATREVTWSRAFPKRLRSGRCR